MKTLRKGFDLSGEEMITAEILDILAEIIADDVLKKADTVSQEENYVKNTMRDLCKI